MSSLRASLVLVLLPAVLGLELQLRKTQAVLQAQNFNPKNCHPKRRATMLAHNMSINKVNSTGNSTMPGTGMSPADTKKELFDSPKIYMDGFSMAACVKDYMFYHGDKFGSNKFSYEIQDSSNVSITIYTDLIPKEDQQLMTPEVCFDFCRKQKDMLFFGIVNGRDCYCAPYVKAMASNDNVCDAPCEGNTGVMCGTKEKSSIFEMHSCDDTSEQLSAALEGFTKITDEVKAIGTTMTTDGEALIKDANALQEAFGKAGDPTVADLFQKTIGMLSDAKNDATAALAFVDAQADLISKAGMLKSADLSLFGSADEADETIVNMKKGKADAEKLAESLNETALSLFGDPALNTTNASLQYYPIMYFIDKTYNETPTTCGGKVVDIDIGLTKDGCAGKCDFMGSTSKEGCVGFLYVPGTEKDSYCYMFDVFTSVQYYTGCKTEAFLQAKKGHAGTMCYGKLSKFVGGAPPLDKTKQEKATEASSRCVPEF